MSKLPSKKTVDALSELLGGGWNGTVRISVDAEWEENTGAANIRSADAPEQADPDTDMAALLEAFKNIRFDDFHDIDFSDDQKNDLLVKVRGWGGWGGGGRG